MTCKGCTKRVIGCHATCPDYQEYDAKRKAMLAEKAKDSLYCETPFKKHLAYDAYTGGQRFK